MDQSDAWARGVEAAIDGSSKTAASVGRPKMHLIVGAVAKAADVLARADSSR